MKEYNTIEKQVEGIIIEKKSKFIATVIPVESKKQAEEKIKEIKKKYMDARHNCYAYCVLEEENIITKSSDDGEPSGTAGIPILKAITENSLCNVVVVVTRYFGGILLGTGGLQRAYTSAVLEGVKNATILKKQIGYEIEIGINYSDLNYVKYYVEQMGGKILDINYTEKIKIKLEITETGKLEIENQDNTIGNKIQKIYKISKKYI